MLELATVAVQLATAVLGYIQTEALLKYVREAKNLRDQLDEEIAKGEESDDAKVEALYDKLANTLAAYYQQVAILQAAKGMPITAAVGPAK